MVARGTRVPDSDLVARLLIRDGDALAKLYDHYAALAYTVLIRVTRNPGASEDLLQELFFRIWTRIGDFDALRGSLGTWIVSIARNLALDYLRSARTRTDVSGCSLREMENFSTNTRPDSSMEHADMIRKTFSSLTTYQRRLLEMAYLDGCSQSEIADRLRTPLGTIKSRMRMALQEVRLAAAALA